MSDEVFKYALLALGLLGAAGTWLRAVVALREHRAAQRVRRWGNR